MMEQGVDEFLNLATEILLYKDALIKEFLKLDKRNVICTFWKSDTNTHFFADGLEISLNNGKFMNAFIKRDKINKVYNFNDKHKSFIECDDKNSVYIKAEGFPRNFSIGFDNFGHGRYFFECKESKAIVEIGEDNKISNVESVTQLYGQGKYDGNESYDIKDAIRPLQEEFEALKKDMNKIFENILKKRMLLRFQGLFGKNKYSVYMWKNHIGQFYSDNERKFDYKITDSEIAKPRKFDDMQKFLKGRTI